MNTTTNQIVSFDSERLLLVDENDEIVGTETKDKCHQDTGLLHRAFSIFIFNEQGEILLQQRSKQKRLWPLYWSNSCCSHPREGETMTLASQRRLSEELGLTCTLDFIYKFKYQARFDSTGAEHEYCWVYVGKDNGPVKENKNEIAAWRFIKPADLDVELLQSPDLFTPWLKLEWSRLRSDYPNAIPE